MRQKTARKAEFDNFANCMNEDRSHKGIWRNFFNNAGSLVLELGCGKADLSMALAARFPEQNFVGVDVKAPRMWVGAKQAIDTGIKNIAFLRCHIETITEYFSPGEVDEIWITFPDPFPRKRNIKHRLTQIRFLEPYKQILKPGGIIHFKTDNDSLFEWTLEHFEELNQGGKMKINVLAQTRDLHHSEVLDERNCITTDFEKRFLSEGKSINYLRFTMS